MRKIALFVAVLMVASVPSLADAKAKHKRAPKAPAPMAANEAGPRLVGEGLRNFLFVPIASILGVK